MVSRRAKLMWKQSRPWWVNSAAGLSLPERVVILLSSFSLTLKRVFPNSMLSLLVQGSRYTNYCRYIHRIISMLERCCAHTANVNTTDIHVYVYLVFKLFIQHIIFRRTSLSSVWRILTAVSGMPILSMLTGWSWQASPAQYAALCSTSWTIQMQLSVLHLCLKSSWFSTAMRWPLTLH